MAKNRNHYFKVKPGDDARLFSEIDIETEGFIARLRRIAHDREPYGFLVDSQRRPYDAKRIADVVHLTNNRTTVVLSEAHAARLIETAAQFREGLSEASNGGKKAKARLVLFDALCRDLPADVPLTSVYVMPTLIDDLIDSEMAKKIGKLGGNPEIVKFPTERLTMGLTTGLTTPLTTEVNAQKSEVRSQSQRSDSQSSSSPSREREASTARERAGQDERPMTMRSYTARAHEIAVWQESIGAVSEERFTADFEAKFHMTYALWCQIRRDMEASIESSTPQSCRDGHHVLYGAYCRYCPFISVTGEESA